MIEKSRSTSLALATIAILGQPPSLARGVWVTMRVGLYESIMRQPFENPVGIRLACKVNLLQTPQWFQLRAMVTNHHAQRVSDQHFLVIARIPGHQEAFQRQPPLIGEIAHGLPF